MLFNQDQLDIMTKMQNVQSVNRNLISTVILFLETEQQQKDFLAFLNEPDRKNYVQVLDKLEELTGCCGERAQEILR